MNRKMKRTRRASGVSLVETMVTIALLATVLTVIAPIFINYAQLNRKSQYRTEAIAAAQQVTDSLRQRDFAAWPGTGSALPVKIGGNTYQAKVSYCTGPLAALCASGARHTRVEVSLSGTVYYNVETVYTKFE